MYANLYIENAYTHVLLEHKTRTLCNDPIKYCAPYKGIKDTFHIQDLYAKWSYMLKHKMLTMRRCKACYTGLKLLTDLEPTASTKELNEILDVNGAFKL